jgi:PPOX class probable F420-dependent enzyme
VDEASMRARVAQARVGRLATVTAEGRPHVVPCCFVLDGDMVYTAVDDVKAKSTPALRRLDNLRVHPAAALLVDHYDEDWTTLWWIRVDGLGRVAKDGAMRARALELLGAKYRQYAENPPPGAMIAIELESWLAWP